MIQPSKSGGGMEQAFIDYTLQYTTNATSVPTEFPCENYNSVYIRTTQTTSKCHIYKKGAISDSWTDLGKLYAQNAGTFDVSDAILLGVGEDGYSNRPVYITFKS